MYLYVCFFFITGPNINYFIAVQNSETVVTDYVFRRDYGNTRLQWAILLIRSQKRCIIFIVVNIIFVYKLPTMQENYNVIDVWRENKILFGPESHKKIRIQKYVILFIRYFIISIQVFVDIGSVFIIFSTKKNISSNNLFRVLWNKYTKQDSKNK